MRARNEVARLRLLVCEMNNSSLVRYTTPVVVRAASVSGVPRHDGPLGSDSRSKLRVDCSPPAALPGLKVAVVGRRLPLASAPFIRQSG